MQERHLYEYAIIRFLPRVEREEFLNVGVILFCKKAKYIKVLFDLNEEKLNLFCPDFDKEQLWKNLDAFRRIAVADNTGGAIAKMDLPSRFRWLTAVRSSSIQTSRPHPGLSQDLDKTAEKLFTEMVK